MIDGKKVLLVMGGISQLCDIVEDARKKGIYVIVADYLEDSPAKKIADESHLVSITNVDEMVSLCKRRHVDGIMNYCIDPGQKPYHEICSILDLPCYGTKEQFDVMTNKDLFKKCCIKNGVGVVPSYDLNNDYSVKELDKIEFPLMVKPADGRASKGISICHDENDLSNAITFALEFSERGEIVFEKYMDKPEVAVKYFVCDEDIVLTSMSDIYTSFTDGKRNYISTQTFPSKFYDEYIKTTDKKVRKMIEDLEIKNGPLSFSGFVDNDTFRFIDPSYRMGGAQDWRIVSKIGGINISELLTCFALTGKMGNRDNIYKIDGKFSEKSSAMLYFLVRKGRIGEIKGLKNALELDSIIGHHMPHVVGDKVINQGTSDHVAIRFLLVCNDNKELKKDIQTIQSYIEIFDDEGENMLIKNFDVNQIN